MWLEPKERARDASSASGWARLRLVPRPVLLVAFLLLLSALAPAAAGLIATFAPADGSAGVWALANRPGLVSGVSLAWALGVLLVLERPRGRSPLAYARQLRDRLAEIQSDFDGALRRRLGGEREKRHAPEAHRSEP